MRIAPFKLKRLFRSFMPTCRYTLSSVEAETPTVEEILLLEGNEEEWKRLPLKMGRGDGLREAIARRYTQIGPGEVVVTAGGEEAIFLFITSNFQRGDHLIVQFPTYPSHYEVAEALGCEISFWNANEKEHWQLDPNDLKELVRPNTRAILMTLPSNPTGVVMDRERLFQVVDFARAHKLILFADEAMRGLELHREQQLPSVADIYERGISLGSVSKAFGLTSLRVGWLATKLPLMIQEMTEQKDYLSSRIAAPSEWLATYVLRHADRFLDAQRLLSRSHLELFEAFLQRFSDEFHWQRPHISHGLVHLKRETDGDRFAANVAEKVGLLLLPGSCFDLEIPCFRVGFGKAYFPKALAELEKYALTFMGGETRQKTVG